jgi:spore coat polysaccharide biosynthesis protein SpsF (cytidylyltransferase family)
MANKVVCLIQARMQSQRLPGKAMQMLGQRTLLEHCYRRALQAQSVDTVVVATGLNETNRSIVDLCHGQGWPVYQGSDDDVLDRFYHAAMQHQADIIVRVSGDSPLISGELIDHLVALQQSHDYRYVTNSAGTEPGTWPDGLDTEVLTWLTLCHMHKVAVLPSQREHPTSWIWTNLPRYRWNIHTHWPDLSRWRLCVDDANDLRTMRAIMRIAGPNCTWQEAVRILEAPPDLMAQTATRNEGYAVSVAKEQT